MNWYKIVNKSDKAEIWIYEEIGQDFWTGGGVTAKNFQKELAAVKASQIDLHINSPGGAVFDGVAIYNLIKQLGKRHHLHRRHRRLDRLRDSTRGRQGRHG